jgi:hypothetical protein
MTENQGQTTFFASAGHEKRGLSLIFDLLILGSAA